nr:ComEA family DNA-binding protein [Rhodococcus sp. (in: high G+C Gram-positive bacteria)]
MAGLEPRSISRVSLEADRSRGVPDERREEISRDDNADVEVRWSALHPEDGSYRPDWLRADGERESALTPYLPERWRSGRVSPGKAGVRALCALGAVVVLIGGYNLVRRSPEVAPVPALPVVQPQSSAYAEPATGTQAPSAEASSTDVPSMIVVSVVGLVTTAGLVHLPPGSRVADALAAAGGPLQGADLLALNLAAKLDDGAQIVVGSMPPDGRPLVSGTTGQGSGADVVGPGQPGAAESAPAGKVDLNTATAAELDALPGVGPVTAAAIVSWREVNGPFSDVAQLAEVDGIGPVRLEKLRAQVTV